MNVKLNCAPLLCLPFYREVDWDCGVLIEWWRLIIIDHIEMIISLQFTNPKD